MRYYTLPRLYVIRNVLDTEGCVIALRAHEKNNVRRNIRPPFLEKKIQKKRVQDDNIVLDIDAVSLTASEPVRLSCENTELVEMLSKSKTQ